jgi:predicted Rossmann fold nucleotide-binding protein DprA/Smf involved in DNA uptake
MGEEKRRDLGEVLRDEMVMKDRIATLLREEPKTIPEIAEALSCPVREVTLWVMALRRYGSLEELPKPRAEDYYRYRLAR